MKPNYKQLFENEKFLNQNRKKIIYLKLYLSKFDKQEYEYLFIGNPFDNQVNFVSIDSIPYSGTNRVCDREDIAEIRLATDEEQRTYKTYFPL